MMKNELEEGELANKASENPNVSSEIELEQPAIIPVIQPINQNPPPKGNMNNIEPLNNKPKITTPKKHRNRSSSSSDSSSSKDNAQNKKHRHHSKHQGKHRRSNKRSRSRSTEKRHHHHRRDEKQKKRKEDEKEEKKTRNERNSEKKEKLEKLEKKEINENNGKIQNNEKNQKNEKKDKIQKNDKNDEKDKPEKHSRLEKNQRIERHSRPEKSQKNPERNPKNYERSDKKHTLHSKPVHDDEENIDLSMELEKEKNETQLIEERRKKRQEMLANLQQNQELAPNADELSEELVMRKPSASKADVEKYNYIKMVDAMREKNMEEKKTEEENTNNVNNNNNGNKPEMFDMFNESLINLENSTLSTNIIKPDILEWDDEEHYYKVQIGEIIDKQYQIIGKCGKGVFSTVVRAVNITTKQPVAIKIIRSDEILMRAGQREIGILQKLNEADKFEKKHIIKLMGSFEYRRHLCLVFEPMDQDLRETLKIFGKKVGLSLDAVRSYATQIFLSLSHLKKNKIIHADIKPDNILTTNNLKTIKLCDFGTAMPVEENSIVEYLVSRYYRAPEIILGYPYGTSIDIWSAACTIYEIYVGSFLFPGRNNNEMIKLIMLTKGKFNNKILRRGEFVYKYFDNNYNFLSCEIDPITKEEYVKAITVNDKPIRDLGGLLNIYEGEQADKKLLLSLKDLLDKCLCLDPAKRMTPEEALKHPFISQLTGGGDKMRK